MIFRTFLSFLIVFLFTVSGYSYVPGKKYSLTFFHVSDTHGYFFKSPQTNAGGFASLGTMVKNARAQAQKNGELFFLTSGGDVNTGTPESDLLMAEPDFRAMNLLGFDAMAVGNHEFDRPWKYLLVQQGWAQFPFLAANVHPNQRQAFPIIPYVIKEQQGLKVAFLGLATETTPFQSVPANSVGVTFDSSVETAKRWVPFLAKRADVVVILSHLGWCEGGRCQGPNDFLVANSVPGVDVILGGHSHTDMAQPAVVNGAFIFHTFEKLQKVGVMSFEFQDGSLKLQKAELAPIVAPEDPEVLELLNPLLEQSSEKLKVVAGETPVLLDGERVNIRSKETNLGNLITKAMKIRANADLALTNGGGIRASIAAGKITYGDIFRVLPFGSTVCTFDMTGRELLSYLGEIAKIAPGAGGFPQMSGVFLRTDRENKILELKINGEPVQLDRLYKIAINNFSAEGGDFYPKVQGLPSFINLGLTLEYALRSYIESAQGVRPEEIAETGYYQKQL